MFASDKSDCRWERRLNYAAVPLFSQEKVAGTLVMVLGLVGLRLHDLEAWCLGGSSRSDDAAISHCRAVPLLNAKTQGSLLTVFG
jgi:hypothetical protein